MEKHYTGDDIHDLFSNGLTQYKIDHLFSQYELTRVEFFDSRLFSWLNNLQDIDDQISLFKIFQEIFFIGGDEITSLFRSVHSRIVPSWLVDLYDIEFSDPNYKSIIESYIDRTWFCPITDSLRINQYLKTNGISGGSHRPDWRSLLRFGDIEKIKNFLASKKIDQVVLLEDFIGSGTQIESVINFVGKNFTETKFLICGLVVCPEGESLATKTAGPYNNLSYVSCLTVDPTFLVKPTRQNNETQIAPVTRSLLSKVSSRLPDSAKCPDSGDFFGYKDTGALIVLYSNCPNNTIPLVYGESIDWSPLFPRVDRK